MLTQNIDCFSLVLGGNVFDPDNAIFKQVVQDRLSRDIISGEKSVNFTNNRECRHHSHFLTEKIANNLSGQRVWKQLLIAEINPKRRVKKDRVGHLVSSNSRIFWS